MAIEIDGHYIANVVFIGVNENAIALSIDSMLLRHLAIDRNLSLIVLCHCISLCWWFYNLATSP